jgi:hypothetical protein
LTVDEPVLCVRCGLVIGAYEPLVVFEDGHARETSLAAEEGLPIAGAEHFHEGCAPGSAPGQSG